MSEYEPHQIEFFPPDGSRCTCGFSGTIEGGVKHLTVPVELALKAAKDAGVIR